MHRLFTTAFALVLGTYAASGVGLQSAQAHIDLLEPTPLLSGRAQNFRALKTPPFGAPGVDVPAAPAYRVQAGSTIHLKLDHYIYHPGEIVVLWTTDPEGGDVAPVFSIPNADTPIPHHNLLYRAPVPSREDYNAGQKQWEADVTLPDVDGVIYLVVRQIMTDKLDAMPDGSVSLKRIYYHQAAKLDLVRE